MLHVAQSHAAGSRQCRVRYAVLHTKWTIVDASVEHGVHQREQCSNVTMHDRVDQRWI